MQEADIFLEENTLIRILLSEDGETLQIELSEGSISVVVSEERASASNAANNETGRTIKNIELSVDGKPVQTQPGAVVIAEKNETRTNIQTVESSVWLENTGRLENLAASVSQLQLYSPAANSIFRYQERLPAIMFQWEDSEDAVSYVIEISNSPNFTSYEFQRETSSAFLSTSLQDGLWFWRIRPVYPFIHENFYSEISFFRIEYTSVFSPENISGTVSEDISENILDWLAEELPSSEDFPDEVPEEIIANYFTEPEPEIEPEPEPEPEPVPPPPARLDAPRNMLPARGTRYGLEELKNLTRISFSWSAVPQANGYIFSLYRQTSSGRRLIMQTNPLSRPAYTLENLGVLDRGTFIWQVEAVGIVSGRIQRRGYLAESSFILDFPDPGEIQIEDIGILYGIE